MIRLPAFLIVASLFLPVIRGGIVAQEETTTETLSGRSLAANDLARLPYSQLLRIAQSDARAAKDAKSYKLRIQSRNSAVTAKDIELYLDVKDAPLVLVVDNDGFVEVPHTQELVASNPDLVANQPRGSLNIFVDLDVPRVSPPEIKDGKVAYQELFRPLVEIQTEMRKVDPNLDSPDSSNSSWKLRPGRSLSKSQGLLGREPIVPTKRAKFI